MKKALVVSTLVVLALGAAGWYLFKGQPAATPGKTSLAVQKQEQAVDPNEHGFFDVDFAQKMIVHHQQAIEMTDAVVATSSNPAVRELATKIRQKQSDAENQYISWLKEWGETYTNLSQFPQMDGHDMYPSYPGLVSAVNMSRLKSASGDERDKLFIDLMIEHHSGGIQTSETSNKLQYAKLINFKNNVVADYKAEVKTMEEL